MEIFSKILTSIDINKGLEIPRDRRDDVLSLPELKLGRTELLVADTEGKPFKFVCSTRSGNIPPNPIFSKGWLEFARDSGLQPGETITFYKEIAAYRKVYVKPSKTHQHTTWRSQKDEKWKLNFTPHYNVIGFFYIILVAASSRLQPPKYASPSPTSTLLLQGLSLEPHENPLSSLQLARMTNNEVELSIAGGGMLTSALTVFAATR
ncbi:hypothetical protein GH714_020373 [Hevea brasiliensis]|uniref:TF-B3 domain-containing protein n=1 Tax=Hevea brasiliensis TaxID=3981 RepID=A0A6A6N6V3_HEVBR|nr:hypothetical protein GH714_020373 [Hevea brasiliensis]